MKKQFYSLFVFVFGGLGVVCGQSTEVYLNAGSDTEAVFNGRPHLGDVNLTTYYSGGSSYTNANYNQQETLFDSESYGATVGGVLTYNIPVPNGNYTVKTHHNELWFGVDGVEGGPGKRVYDIILEGVVRYSDFDLAVVNNNNPYTFTVNAVAVSDGFLTLELDASVDRAHINGLAIISEDPGNTTERYINMGTLDDFTHQGKLYESELKNRFNSTETYSNTSASSEALFQSERYMDNTVGSLNYDIKVPNGTYTVKTHHNELWFGSSHPSAPPAAAGNRVFDIIIEGALLAHDFDIYTVGNSAYTHTFTGVVVSDGVLSIEMPASVDNATISGIAIEQTAGGTTSLYFNAGGATVSYNGHSYVGDSDIFLSGNSSYSYRYLPLPEVLLTTERYGPNGTLSYTIPLANGIYRVQTHHNEAWFGKGNGAPSAQAGRRVFDISLEGQLVKDDFDIYSESYNYPTTLTFTGVLVSDGVLNLDMISSADNPQINGISITQQSPYHVPALTQSENYVFTRSYQRAMDSFDPTQVSDADVIEQVTYFDGLGRPKQQIALEATRLYTDISSFVSIPQWQMDWSTGTGGTPFYNKNGDTLENERLEGSDPYNNTSLLWMCSDQDTLSAGDGGWNTDNFNIDINKTYRYTVWVKRTGSHEGTTYHGTQNVNNLDGTPNSNPYFWYGDVPQLDQWYLLVGVVHPYDYTGGDSGISGVYDTSGNKVADGSEYTWRSDMSVTRFRDYLFYCSDASVRQYFYGPLLQSLDGTENTLSEVLGSDHSLKDLVTHIGYDAFGRQDKTWLPYQAALGAAGSYRGDVSETTKSFYLKHYPDDFPGLTPTQVNAYSQTDFEASPLNRPKRQAAPGKDWALGSGHEIAFGYQSNAAAAVRKFTVSFPDANNPLEPELSFGTSDHYPANTLYKTITKDENHPKDGTMDHSTEEFKDKDARVVLKRSYNNQTAHDTYYVYSKYGQLSYVLPPKAIEKLTQIGFDKTHSDYPAIMDALCYQYKYDYRNRLVEKKIPGKGWEYIVYNQLDQPILTQDANQRANNQWLFTKYDIFGRSVQTGIYSHGSTLDQKQMAAVYTTYYQNNPTARVYEAKNTDGLTHYYTNESFPVANLEVHAVHYFDNYSFDTAQQSLPATTGFGQSVINYDNNSPQQTKGQATGSKVRVLGTGLWITTLMGYDTKKRVIYQTSNNAYLQTTDITEREVDFPGRITKQKNTHSKNGQNIVTLDTMSYDENGRLTGQSQELAGHTEQLAENTYDNLGQLIQKNVGNSPGAPLQTVDYRYNIRGWLKGINDINTLGSDLFGFSLHYNNPQNGATALFNGNISETHWKTANDNIERWYSYGYDPLNRIISATSSDTNYNLGLVEYDKNGNITKLQRNGHLDPNVTSFGLMDDLTYSYNVGNKLQAVDDDPLASSVTGFIDGAESTTEYTYDDNGNILTDTNKGITGVIYNHLNLPTKVTVASSQHNGTIDYIYDATGVKLKKIITDPVNGDSETIYAGNFIYEGGNLRMFTTYEGYIEPTNDPERPFIYTYQFKDHLGSIRLSYTDSDPDPDVETVEVVEENNYYPFGLQHKGYNNVINGTENNYRTFQGQEEEKELGKNIYAFQWRDYDPAIGRFNKIDRFTEEYKNVSPYQFALNSPIRYTEIKGDSINLRSIQQYDKKNGTNYTQTIINNLSKITGLQLTADSKTGMLTYATDDDGNAIVTQVAYEDENGVIRDDVTVDGGSETARNDLISAIDNKKTGFARINNKSSALRGGLLINISPTQIDKFINGANNVNNNTLGYGMTFLHEMHHSALGLGVGDDNSKIGATGGVVDRMNIIRSQLSSQSFTQSYGQRTSYKAAGYSGKAYLPMDQGSLERLNKGNKPTTALQKFIKF